MAITEAKRRILVVKGTKRIEDRIAVAIESQLEKGLPRQTESLCPECLSIIPATLYEEDGALKMRKKCKEHGTFKDVCWSDAKMYLKAESWAFDGVGIENPQIKDAKVCPYECGLCNLHYSHTCLANVDLTNRCNLKCPICFANANSAGYVFEPTYEQVFEMLKILREERPVPCNAVQFSGGEPTIHPDFFRVLEAARLLGFAQIQVATNGIKFAMDGFAQKATDSGLHTVYLQFDGLKEENYVRARGKPLLRTKLEAIEKIRGVRPSPPSVVLVPTVVNTINDDQVGEILEFAIKNADVVRGVNYQPVSLAGRVPNEEREKLRFTLSDLAIRLEEQVGYISREDWYPVPFVAPISELVSVLQESQKVAFTSHPACGIATYLFLEEGKEPLPITRFIDVEGLMTDLWSLSQKAKHSRAKFISKIKALGILRRHFMEEEAPEGMDLASFLRILRTIFDKGDKKGLSDFSWRMMYVGGMHFQDNYNYDIERVKRCTIHYATPDGRIIPFCAYNTGPCYREEVEKKFSVPLEEWRRRHGNEYT